MISDDTKRQLVLDDIDQSHFRQPDLGRLLQQLRRVIQRGQRVPDFMRDAAGQLGQGVNRKLYGASGNHVVVGQKDHCADPAVTRQRNETGQHLGLARFEHHGLGVGGRVLFPVFQGLVEAGGK